MAQQWTRCDDFSGREIAELEVKLMCCISDVLQVEFLSSQLVRARIKVSAAAETLQQHSATYAEFDPLICPPQPSNPWLSDDPTYWVLNAPV